MPDAEYRDSVEPRADSCACSAKLWERKEVVPHCGAIVDRPSPVPTSSSRWSRGLKRSVGGGATAGGHEEGHGRLNPVAALTEGLK